MTAARHIAHFNWATLRAPVGDDRVAGFVNAVPKVNALAERSPGFVWRSGMEAELASAAGWPLFVGNDRLIASFSVWESPEALRAYVYQTVHGAFFRRSDEWFEPGASRGHALWWVPVGHVPTITEARGKVDALAAEGPSEAVFTFAQLPAG
ncbi:DUF3291 domain-containing protein [Rhodobacterales bacterium HKCCSP123]|nr:DUF3291 domain-containing protein [Rhodobacterales bacterium HKCCSP123]